MLQTSKVLGASHVRVAIRKEKGIWGLFTTVGGVAARPWSVVTDFAREYAGKDLQGLGISAVEISRNVRTLRSRKGYKSEENLYGNVGGRNTRYCDLQ